MGREAMARLVPVNRRLQAAARMKDADPAGVLPYWVFATDTISHAARKLALLGKGGADAPAGRKSLAREAAALQKRFESLWMASNRRSEIGVTLKRYRAAIAALKKPAAPPREEKPVEYKYLLRLPKGYERGAMPLRVLAEEHVRTTAKEKTKHGRDPYGQAVRDTHGQDPYGAVGLAHATKRWPLMLFLHGAGERGDNLQLVKAHGPPKVADKLDAKSFPFILVAPQCPANKLWSIKPLLALLDKVMREYPVDPARVYLTGISMGGFGTWALAAEAPARFAAIAPICGGGDPASAPKLKKVPIWTFHGAKDTVVPIELTQKIVDAVKKAGGEVKFTIYPEASHDSWTATYNNPALYRWLLAQKKGRG
jgi:predicted esterase